MIILDTHIWVWWSTRNPRLTESQYRTIDQSHEPLGICSVSLREIAVAVERGRIEIDIDLTQWFDDLLQSRRFKVIPLSAEVAIESARLPGQLHRDPFDQIIVATARVHDARLMTSDGKILKYPHVRHVALS